jgi:hypothetical protein
MFRFLHIFIVFVQSYEDENCGRFVHHILDIRECLAYFSYFRIHSIIVHKKAYFIHFWSRDFSRKINLIVIFVFLRTELLVVHFSVQIIYLLPRNGSYKLFIVFFYLTILFFIYNYIYTPMYELFKFLYLNNLLVTKGMETITVI